MLGVDDLARSKRFYGEGFGCAIERDYPNFVSFNLGDGSSLALYQREAAAQEAGVSSAGSGFRGVSFHYIVASSGAVAAAIAKALAAGGRGVKAAADAQRGGYTGYFSDSAGFFWSVPSAW